MLTKDDLGTHVTKDDMHWWLASDYTVFTWLQLSENLTGPPLRAIKKFQLHFPLGAFSIPLRLAEYSDFN